MDVGSGNSSTAVAARLSRIASLIVNRHLNIVHRMLDIFFSSMQAIHKR
jgi:hypothetical protein